MEEEPSIREIIYDKRNADPIKAAKLQRINQTEAVLKPYCSDESPIAVAESSGYTLTPATASASRLPDFSDDPLAMIDISSFTMLKIIDKKTRPG